MSNQKDIDDYTSREEMEADGWKFIGTQNSPRWERKSAPGKTEYFGRNPDGFYRHLNGRKQANGSGSIQKIIISPMALRALVSVFNRNEDGYELFSPLLCSRDGNEVTIHDAIDPYSAGASLYRTESSSEVRDGAGFAAEEYRVDNGLPWIYAGLAHTHPEGSNPVPSEADEIVLTSRTRKSLGDAFIGIICVPELRGVSMDWTSNLRAYAAEHVNGRSRVAPVPIVLDTEEAY